MKKFTAFIIVAFLILSPLAPVFAEEASSSASASAEASSSASSSSSSISSSDASHNTVTETTTSTETNTETTTSTTGDATASAEADAEASASATAETQSGTTTSTSSSESHSESYSQSSATSTDYDSDHDNDNDNDNDGNNNPPCVHTCALPHSEGDSTSEIIMASPDGNGSNLQEIFTARGFGINAVNDQRGYQVWNVANATTTVTIEYVAHFADYAHVFGYYLNGDTNTFKPLFTSTSTIGTTATFTVAPLSVVGFAIHAGPDFSNTTAYYSQNTQNGGEDHMLAYDLDDNTFIIAFEDLPLTSSDKDYNDMVVKITTTCDTGSNGGSTTHPWNPPASPTCTELAAATGWFATYFDYVATHPHMEESTDTWGNSHGDPLGATASWTADWYNASYKKFDRIDTHLKFGEDFFPLDIISDAEMTNGHNYHFGVVWSAKITASSTGDYTYTLTSDDDAWIYVDNVLKVDNSSVHPPVTKMGTINLTEGTHTIQIFFAERHTVRSHMYFAFDDASLVIKPYNPTCPTTPPTGPTNTPPHITLIGANPFIVATNTPFIDPGATSTDAEDGDLTSQIVITGSVNASTTGTYTLTYSVTDSGGLSTSTTRTVIINATSTPATTTPPVDNGGNGGDNGGGNNGGGSSTGGSSSGGGGMSGGRRRDVSNLISTGGQVLGATDCSYLRDYLRRDWNNDPVEMLKLQSFLNAFEKESLVLNGTFDDATFAAVSRFQNKYFGDILEPWGHTAPTGFVYILTKKKVNEIYCNTLLLLTPEQQQEINTFRSYLESLNTQYNRNIPPGVIDIDNYVGQNNGETSSTSTIGSIASSVKDTIAGVTDGGTLRNLAVSLFGAPKGLKEISSTYLLIILGIILIAAFAPRRNPNSTVVLEKSMKSEPLSHVESTTEIQKELDAVMAPEAPKPEDFEDPTPPTPVIPMGPASDKPEDKDKGFKGIIG